jgi:hypothetical protein
MPDLSSISKQQLSILQHSLGVDQYGAGQQYRNHYVAGGCDLVVCRELTAAGSMQEHAASAITGGSPWFSVTRKGIDEVALSSPVPPPPPKLTRSQLRYRQYLRSECCESFGEWLKFGMWREYPHLR